MLTLMLLSIAISGCATVQAARDIKVDRAVRIVHGEPITKVFNPFDIFQLAVRGGHFVDAVQELRAWGRAGVSIPLFSGTWPRHGQGGVELGRLPELPTAWQKERPHVVAF